MKAADFKIRDPFVLPWKGTYYLYASDYMHDFIVRTSSDLENWSEPRKVTNLPGDFWATRDFWAPEVHDYRGSFYLFATMFSDTRNRGTQIFRADSPEGPFEPISEGPVTPADWMCLDGTLFVEDGQPWMVFCHEWLQVRNGTMCRIPLSQDLTHAIGEPVEMFAALDYDFVRRCPGVKLDPDGGYVTDGPFFHRCAGGELLMIWSSFGEKGYLQSVLRSDNGRLDGKWIPQELLFDTDGGHGMLFRDFEGQLRLALHHPNAGPERLKLFRLEEKDGTLRVLPEGEKL